jgi:hypothetical protein
MKAKNIKTVEQFAEKCRGKSREQIYELFEDKISDELRNQIYTEFWSNSPEPCRAAMIQIGARYCVGELIEY